MHLTLRWMILLGILLLSKLTFHRYLSGIQSELTDQAWRLVEPDLGPNCLQNFNVISRSQKWSLVEKKYQGVKEVHILGQVWYLVVSIPDLCTLTYFDYQSCVCAAWRP